MMMIMPLERRVYTEKSTIGKLFLDGAFECYTLEDRVRAVKLPGATAVPAGNYEVAITWSNKFLQFMPLLLNVPNFAGIRVHWGNKPEHTDGCILVGQSAGDDIVGTSKAACESLLRKLNRAAKRGKILIQIYGGSERDVAMSEDLATLAA